MDVEQKRFQANSSSSCLVGTRLLLVDDNIDTQTLFTFVLEDHGAEVVAVPSAEEAMLVLERVKPDLLISDINLIGEDGYSLIKKVRSLSVEQGGQIPAIAVTGILQENTLLSSAAGFQLHLTKPVDLEELVKAVVTLTQSKIAA